MLDGELGDLSDRSVFTQTARLLQQSLGSLPKVKVAILS